MFQSSWENIQHWWFVRKDKLSDSRITNCVSEWVFKQLFEAKNQLVRVKLTLATMVNKNLNMTKRLSFQIWQNLSMAHNHQTWTMNPPPVRTSNALTNYNPRTKLNGRHQTLSSSNHRVLTGIFRLHNSCDSKNRWSSWWKYWDLA